MIEGSVLGIRKYLARKEQIWINKRLQYPNEKPHYIYFFSNSRKVRKLLKKAKALI